MGIDILNFKHVGLIVFVFFIMLTTVESSTITGPRVEVVSIYNDNFTTLPSRYPYFIKVYRCVKVLDDDVFECGSDRYPVPENMTEIEIVVPDLTNKDRDLSNEKKFYRYVVYNHTSCKCGRYSERKLYKTITNNLVSEKYFRGNYSNNPENLQSQIDLCNKTQIRYKLHPDNFTVLPKYKYLAYEQCLPGCVVKSNVMFLNKTRKASDTTKVIMVKLINDTLCEAYDR